MFSILTGKLKIYLYAAFAALLPILYILGRKDGAKLNEVEHLIDDVETEKDRAEFYKNMEADESTSINNRSELIDRLRDKGL